MHLHVLLDDVMHKIFSSHMDRFTSMNILHVHADADADTYDCIHQCILEVTHIRCICTTDSVDQRHICIIAYDEDAVQIHIASICMYVEDAVHVVRSTNIGLDL